MKNKKRRFFLFSITKIFFVMAVLSISPTFGYEIKYPNNRAPNDFYISGDTFRSHCNFVYDETDLYLNPLNVHERDIIFIKNDFLETFFKNIHPKINCKYIIVTHNSDYPAPWKYLEYLEDEKIIVWFAQNADCQHKKVIPIPIGLANRCWKHGNVKIMDEVRKVNYKKVHLAYLNICVSTYPIERKEVFNLFNDKSFCFDSNRKDYKSYLIDVACSKFVISPRGNGLDTHRLWEALYLGAIPIVKTSSLDSLYKDLPILIIEDWKCVTEQFLLEKYQEMQNKNYNFEKLNIKYWFDQMDFFHLKE